MKSSINLKVIITIICGLVSLICIILIVNTLGVKHLGNKNPSSTDNQYENTNNSNCVEGVKKSISQDEALEISKNTIFKYFNDNIEELSLKPSILLDEGTKIRSYDVFIITWCDIDTSNVRYTVAVRKDNGLIERAINLDKNEESSLKVITKLGAENMAKDFIERVYGISLRDNSSFIIDDDSHYGYKATFEVSGIKNIKIVMGINPYIGKVDNVTNVYN